MRDLPNRPVKVERWVCETANAKDYETEHEAYLAEVGAWVENRLLDVGRLLDASPNETRKGLEYILRLWPLEIAEIAKTCHALELSRRGG